MSSNHLHLQVERRTRGYLHHPDTTRWTIPASDVPTLIGRSSECDVKLPADSVSREHARIRWQDDTWLIHDLSSKAGTLLNGIRLGINQELRISSGDQIQMGPILLQVTLQHPGKLDDEPSLGNLDSSLSSFLVASELEGKLSTIHNADLSGLAQHRLALLLKSTARLAESTDLPTLANSIAHIAAKGAGSRRAMVIGVLSEDDWVVWGQYDKEGPATGTWEISRSLVALARSGEIAQLNQRLDQHGLDSPSIRDLHIRSAIGIPIPVGDRVEAVLYLDARDQEKPILEDATSYCVGLAQLAGIAVGNLRRNELQAQEKRFREELQAAREAQRHLLPASEGVAGSVRYAAESVPGTIVAGDLFDVMALDDTRTLVTFGDVMGKGAPAGVMMATIQAYFRALAKTPVTDDLPRLVDNANQFFYRTFRDSGFVTFWIGLFQLHNSHVQYVDAGHGHWEVVGHDGLRESLLREGGPPIGAVRDATYTEGRLLLNPGERIILYSDGLVEQQNDAGTFFSREDLVGCLSGSQNPSEDRRRLMERHLQFRESIPLADDLTIASIQFRLTKE